MSDGTTGRDFLAGMPAKVAGQRKLLEHLLTSVEREPAYRWVELSCSLARGVGDELSDVDAGIGISDDGWPAGVDDVEALVRSLAEVVDVFRQRMAGRGDEPVWHLFTQYADGRQLSLVAMPASWRRGLPPQAVALYDADATLAASYEPPSLAATVEDVQEWAWLGWIALADTVKYLRRGSLWEARAAVERTRAELWRLWATARGAQYPVFGLTSVLDLEHPVLPDGVEATVAGLDGVGLRAAATALGGLLEPVSVAASDAVTPTATLPRRMPAYVRRLLDELG